MLYDMHCLYNVVIVVVENKFQFNSKIQYQYLTMCEDVAVSCDAHGEL